MLTAAKGVIRGNVVVFENENLSMHDGEEVVVTFLGTPSGKQKDIQTLEKIQGLFENDKGWESEESMVSDLASFRRSRMG